MERGEIVADMTPDEILASELLETHGIREPLYLSALKAAKAPLTSEHKLSNLKALDYKRFRPAVQAWFAERPTPVAEKQYQPLLEVHGLTYSYDGEKNALEDVSFKIGKGEFVSILGKNGSGKSTITKIIMGVQLDLAMIPLLSQNPVKITEPSSLQCSTQPHNPYL